MNKEKLKSIGKVILVLIVYLLTLYFIKRLEATPTSLNLVFLPIIFAGFLISTTASVALSLVTALYMFLTAGILDAQQIAGLSIYSISLIIVAASSGTFFNYLKSRALIESVEKKKLASVNKVSTHFITSLEPAAVYDQFVREARRIMAVDGALLAKSTKTGSLVVLAEENASDLLIRKNLLYLKQIVSSIKNDDIVQVSAEEFGGSFPFSSIYVSPIINSEFLVLLSKRPRKLTKDEIELLKAYLDDAHLALSGAHYYSLKEKQSELIHLIADLNKLVASMTEIDELIYRTLKRVSEFLNCDQAVFVSFDEGKAEILSTYDKAERFNQKMNALVEKTVLSKTFAEKVSKENRALMEVKGQERLEVFKDFLKESGYHSLIYLPISIQNKTQGAIIAFYKQEPITEGDEEIFESLASEISMVFYNSKLISQIKTLTLKTVESIAAAFDSLSVYTRGHSAKVAKYATAIAKEMNLSFKEIREIQYAALLHDFGRIFIDRKIIDAPRKLAPEELEKIKKIPAISSKIFERINYFNSIIPIIYHHKERFDGSGYPDGLKGEKIPLGSRIIHVAEAFVAMTSERPHRPAMSISEAIKEIQKNSGKQFDPKVVEAFIKALRSEHPSLLVDVFA